MFYCVEDWDDLQIDLHVSFHDGFKIQFAGIIPVFLEFNEELLRPRAVSSSVAELYIRETLLLFLLIAIHRICICISVSTSRTDGNVALRSYKKNGNKVSTSTFHSGGGGAKK